VRGLRTVGGVALALLLGVAFTPLPNVLSRWMSVGAEPEPADAIVVLGAGGVRPDGTLTDTSLRRTLHGMQLYRRGLAPLLVLSGPARRGTRAEALARADLARQCGIPAGAILVSWDARTTRQEAVSIGALLLPRGARKILLVADTQGTGRALGVFRSAGFEVVPAPVGDVSDLGGSPETRFALMRRVLMEALAWPVYRLSGYP
jgi:uncharacterized SAM-binding protein YcdF (DUF218 family)